ncbi:hypothetical protein [Yoonia sp.]
MSIGLPAIVLVLMGGLNPGGIFAAALLALTSGAVMMTGMN